MPSQPLGNSAEEQPSPKRRSNLQGADKANRRARRKKPELRPSVRSASANPASAAGHVAGAALLLAGLPFLGICLAAPHVTGAVGLAISDTLYAAFGRSAWLLPFLTLGWTMRMLTPGMLGSLRVGWPALLLWLDLTLLAQRMGGQGGQLGLGLDLLLQQALGPAGCWIVGFAGLAGSLLLVCQIPLSEVGRVLASLARKVGQRIWRGVKSLGNALATLNPGPWKEEPSADELPAVTAVSEERPLTAWETSSGTATVMSDEGWETAVDQTFEPPFSDEGTVVDESFVEDSLSHEVAYSDESVPTVEPPRQPTESQWTPPSQPAVPTAEEKPRSAAPPKVAPIANGILEDPDGQLRLFPGPAKIPSATYKLPPLSLLDSPPAQARRRPEEDKSQILIDTLQSFGVEARVSHIVRGPTITRYELQPARGVKVNRFTALTNDIALALAATSVRIEAPIPGKAAIGIEIPNRSTDLVVLRDILQAQSFSKSNGLSLGLGLDLTGQPAVTDLQKMPHLLVAGTTGSGKSVCINTLILSLLYRFTPRQLQMLMIDPKQVELSIYEGLPHLVGFSNQKPGQIVVDPKKAALTLNQIVELMEQRYATFASLRVRNLAEYNSKAPEPLPWVVVIIDELADLMMVASKSVETSICRLAQKARAAGIHVVVATQRPSTDVITGLIKVNIPSRIAFAVTSQVDSRVILDTGGAEQLLGKGDMLFLPVEASDPRRLQGAYVSNDEIQRVVEFWKAQSHPENLIELAISENAGLEAEEEPQENEDDALLQQALEVVLRTQQASASMLQTELKVGYARARRILTLMERKGWVGPAEGSKPRKILYNGG